MLLSEGCFSAPTIHCGTYGPSFFINIGTSYELTAYFASPAFGTIITPFLFGCTPASMSKGTAESVSFTYYKNSFYQQTANLSANNQPFLFLSNDFLQYSVEFPYVVSASNFTDHSNFHQFSMAYGSAYNTLESISYFGTISKFWDLKSHFASLMTIDNLFEFKSDPDPASTYNYLITFEYNDPVLPYHATNITVYNNGVVEEMSGIQYYTNPNSLITKIVRQEFIPPEQWVATIDYDSEGLATSLCTPNECFGFEYDSFGRTVSTTRNGVTLVTFTYLTVNGVSLIQSMVTELGRWVFSY